MEYMASEKERIMAELKAAEKCSPMPTEETLTVFTSRCRTLTVDAFLKAHKIKDFLFGHTTDCVPPDANVDCVKSEVVFTADGLHALNGCLDDIMKMLGL